MVSQHSYIRMSITDVTARVFEYTERQDSKIAKRVRAWLDKDHNQFYDDGYVLIIEGNMPNYVYNYINSHANRILLKE